MKACEVMRTDVESCQTTDVVETAAERMRSLNIGFLPVCDDQGSVVGTLTDRDLAVRVLAGHLAPSTKIQAIMSREVICCNPDDDLEVVEDLMSEFKKSRIVCVDDEHKPIGIISVSDVVEHEPFHRVSHVYSAISRRGAKDVKRS